MKSIESEEFDLKNLVSVFGKLCTAAESLTSGFITDMGKVFANFENLTLAEIDTCSIFENLTLAEIDTCSQICYGLGQEDISALKEVEPENRAEWWSYKSDNPKIVEVLCNSTDAIIKVLGSNSFLFDDVSIHPDLQTTPSRDGEAAQWSVIIEKLDRIEGKIDDLTLDMELLRRK